MPQAARTQKWLGEWSLAVTVCVVLLLLRSWFFIAWEESYFHSDQAIVGLMAKHLAEGRALPLFFYGQEYMLGVEAWWMAPFIALFGPSVATLRVAMVALNLVTGLLLVRLLVKDAGLSLPGAVTASAPFWIAPVILSSHLVEAQGGNIEPFFWALLAWTIRRRRLLLGAVLAVAVMNREFSVYAVPMLLLAHVVAVRDGERAWRPLLLDWIATAAAFLIVFTAVQMLKPYADLMGPGTAGVPVVTQGQDSIALASQRVRLNVSELGERFSQLVTDFVPTIFGFKSFQPITLAILSDVRVGWPAAGIVSALLGVAAVALLLFDGRRWLRSGSRWHLPVYLIGIGAIALVAYPVARPLSVYTLRYGLLSLFAPIGLLALMLHRDVRPVLRLLASAAVLVFATASIADHVRVLARAFSSPPSTPMRDVVERLEARQVHVAFADYWHSYNITYLSGESVKVAATQFERILEYKAIAGRPVDAISPGGVVVIQKEPCETGGERVGVVYLCDWR